jgi:outer membrane protein assembly factor BamE (lipoprotein component of BamABCDE complex)
MKYLIALAAIFALNSCNTSIGLYRDTKQAYSWTKEKIQGMNSSGGGSGGGEDYGAPVY